MNILVIGGTRFFGIHMVNELLTAGYDVTIATRGKASDSFGDKVKRIFLERTKEESVREALSGTHYDVVIDKIAYCSNDIKYVMDVIDCDKYIYMSSTSVYNPKHINTVEADFDGIENELIWCDRKDNLWKEPYDVLVEYPVILSTTFSSRNSLNSDVVYDYLIMDEASQVDIATGALALSCARNVVIVGDTKQLPNVVTDDIKAKAKAIFDSFNVSEGYQYTNSFLQSILDVMPNVTQTLLREEDTVQASRDLLKNHIMELYEIPLLRFMTNGSGEREKIVEMLDKFV